VEDLFNTLCEWEPVEIHEDLLRGHRTSEGKLNPCLFLNKRQHLIQGYPLGMDGEPIPINLDRVSATCCPEVAAHHHSHYQHHQGAQLYPQPHLQPFTP